MAVNILNLFQRNPYPQMASNTVDRNHFIRDIIFKCNKLVLLLLAMPEGAFNAYLNLAITITAARVEGNEKRRMRVKRKWKRKYKRGK